VGDPQWIGILERIGEPHSARNRFTARYAYMIVPVGKTLDLNFIDNDAKGLDMTMNENGFMRNQGFGSWEINMAAFLADLNTNVWNPPASRYEYITDPAISSRGVAFIDARELLTWRYAPPDWQIGVNPSPHRYLASVEALFGMAGDAAFPSDMIDGYSNGFGPTGVDNDDPQQPWPGAESKKHFFSMHDLFRAPKPPDYPNLINHLTQASTGPSLYDRYTPYRLLCQLGTDSAPEPEDKINLNYINVDVPGLGPVKASDFIPWVKTNITNFRGRPVNVDINGVELFFTNVVARLLREEFGRFSWREGIPIFTNNSARFTNFSGLVERLYSPRIHQLLQLAANIYDGTHGSKTGEDYPHYPTVLRPQFETRGRDVFITNYVEEPSTNFMRRAWRDVEEAMYEPIKPDDNVYGIPLIIGAKKGFPNFNKFSLQTHVLVNRKLEFRKRSVNDRFPNETNQMFMIGVTNSFAIEAFNSYSNAFPRRLDMVVANVMTTVLTNDSVMPPVSKRLPVGMATNIPPGQWLGLTTPQSMQPYQVPVYTNLITLSNSVFYLTPSPHLEFVGSGNTFERNQRSYTNHWGLTVTNRCLFFLIDNGHVVDAVSLAGLDTLFDISQELNKELAPASSPSVAKLWSIKPFKNVNEGVNNQILVSLDKNISGESDWANYELGGDK
jgi:hypothetical protein